jgi:hypothetical protein
MKKTLLETGDQFRQKAMGEHCPSVRPKTLGHGHAVGAWWVNTPACSCHVCVTCVPMIVNSCQWLSVPCVCVLCVGGGEPVFTCQCLAPG